MRPSSAGFSSGWAGSFKPSGIMHKSSLGLCTLLLLASCDRAQKHPKVSTASPKPDPIKSAKPISAPLADTFQVRNGVLRLLPVTKAAFNQLPGSALPPQPDSIDSPAITATKGRVYRKGSRLIFTLDNGRKTVVRDDTTDTDQMSAHYYWGELAKAHQWVLFVGLWEGSQALLVDQRTGQKTYAWDQPVASPDGKYVVTYSYDMAYNPTGLQLYQVGPDGLRRLWERNTSWGPIGVKWLNNRALAIEKQDLPDSPSTWVGLEILPGLRK